MGKTHRLAATLVALGGLWSAGPARAQTSGIDQPVQIEMLSGVKRINPAPLVAPAPTPPPPPTYTFRPVPAPPPPPVVIRSEPAIVPPPVVVKPTLPPPPPMPSVLEVIAPRKPVELPKRVEPPVVPPMPRAVELPAVAAPVPPAPVAQTNLPTWLQGPLGPVVLAVGGVIVLVPLVGLMLCAMLKWFGPVVRVELIGGSLLPPGLTLMAHPGHGLPGPHLDALPVGDDEEESVVPNFDLGPTYEEEMALQAECERQREAGLLQKIFEDNAQLREDLHWVEQPRRTDFSHELVPLGLMEITPQEAGEPVGV